MLYSKSFVVLVLKLSSLIYFELIILCGVWISFVYLWISSCSNTICWNSYSPVHCLVSLWFVLTYSLRNSLPWIWQKDRTCLSCSFTLNHPAYSIIQSNMKFPKCIQEDRFTQVSRKFTNVTAVSFLLWNEGGGNWTMGTLQLEKIMPGTFCYSFLSPLCLSLP
jgi:hypothetical protein